MEAHWVVPLAAVFALVVLVIAGGFWRQRKRSSGGGPLKGGVPSGQADEGPSALGLVSGLRRTRERLRAIFEGAGSEGGLEVVEEALIAADVGAEFARELVRGLDSVAGNDVEACRQQLAAALLRIFRKTQSPMASWIEEKEKPVALVMVGVNGVGKTTSVAKLAWWLRGRGLKVLLVAADTFRAAAAEQLQRWSERLGVSCVRHQAGGDPAAVVFDGLQAAKSRNMDFVIIDTAGRLHSKQALVAELQKIVRLVQRELGPDRVGVLLVIDATNGQNALAQARVLAEAVPVSGICLTKLDGTAKGGVAVAIVGKLGLPICFVGFGEDLGDWEEFNAESFVRALLGDESGSSDSSVDHAGHLPAKQTASLGA